MAPQTFVTALILSPGGEVKLDPGALHGRSEVESRIEFVQQRDLVSDGKSFWIVWVTLELDATNKPVRYKGLSVCELLISLEQRIGYKSLAEHVNRMGEAIRGWVNVGRLQPEARRLIKEQLISIGAEFWTQSAESFKKALES